MHVQITISWRIAWNEQEVVVKVDTTNHLLCMVINRCYVKNFFSLSANKSTPLWYLIPIYFGNRSFLSSNLKAVGVSIVIQPTNEGSHTSSQSKNRQKRRQVSFIPTNALRRSETPDGRKLVVTYYNIYLTGCNLFCTVFSFNITISCQKNDFLVWNYHTTGARVVN